MDPLDVDRHRLFGLAYRMLGSVADAEDAVQEAFARLAAADDVADPPAWLTTVTTNICIDRLRSARHQRETYVGPWLPEPLLTDDHDPADVVDMAESLTLAFLVVLERLSPVERAVFLLHDVFGHPHDDIATMLDRSPAAVRKLASRARAHLDEDRVRFEPDAARRAGVTEAFLAACDGGDLEGLLEVLAPDVVFTSDGGGVVSAARQPVHGAARVARLALGLARQGRAGGWSVSVVEVNGQPGIVGMRDGQVDTVLALRIRDGHVAEVHGIRNPAKLAAVRRRLSALPE